MKSDLTLDRIPVGEAVTVAYLGESGIRRRLTDIARSATRGLISSTVRS